MSLFPFVGRVVAVRPLAARGAYTQGAEVTLEITRPAQLRYRKPGDTRLPVEGFTVPAWLLKSDEQAAPLRVTVQVQAGRDTPPTIADREAGLLHELASGTRSALALGVPL